MIQHPVYENYFYNPEDTHIYSNFQSKYKQLKNTPDTLGYVEKGLTYNGKKITTNLHRFTWECYNKKLVPEGFHIHHINDKLINGFKINNIENLECLSASEHMKLTRKENQESSKKGGITKGVSGKAINPETKEEKTFTTISDLSRQLKCSHVMILRYLENGQIFKKKSQSLKGFTQIILNNHFEKIEDEIWKQYKKNKKINHELINMGDFTSGLCYISNMGRFYEGMKIKYGQVDKKEYMLFGNKRVHILVMEHFGSPKPSPLHTVHHINNNPSDNRLSNLRWATVSEQNKNTIKNSSKQFSVWNGYTGECLGRFECFTDMKNKIGCSDDDKVFKKPSIKREWFACEYDNMINFKRLEFVNSILNFKKLASFRNFKRDKSLHIRNVSQDERYYLYTVEPTKFTTLKKYTIRIKKDEENALIKIKEISDKNIAAQVVQCYWRSYIRFKEQNFMC